MLSIPDGLLDEIVRRLVDEFHPERIILFGSHAWGMPNEDSDIDLMVIVAERQETSHRLAVRGHRSLREIPVAVDIIVKTRAEFERYASVLASLDCKVRDEGKTLYESCQNGVGELMARQGH